MALSVGLVAMVITLGVIVIGVILPQWGSSALPHFFLRLTTMAGVLVVGSTAMFILAFEGGGPFALAAASATMVLAPSAMCIAVSTPRSRRIPLLIVGAGLLAASAAAAAVLLPATEALAVRLIGVAAACGTCAVLALRGANVPRRSARVLAATTGAFAVYTLLRLMVEVRPDALSGLHRSVFSPAATAIIAAATVLLTGLAVVLIRRSPAERRAAGPQPWTRISFADWARSKNDLGADVLLALLTEVRLAAREVDASAVDVYRGVELRVPSALPAVRSRLQDAYGWRGAQLALLRDDNRQSRRA